jgi:hypothetical protein
VGFGGGGGACRRARGVRPCGATPRSPWLGRRGSCTQLQSSNSVFMPFTCGRAAPHYGRRLRSLREADAVALPPPALTHVMAAHRACASEPCAFQAALAIPSLDRPPSPSEWWGWRGISCLQIPLRARLGAPAAVTRPGAAAPRPGLQRPPAAIFWHQSRCGRMVWPPRAWMALRDAARECLPAAAPATLALNCAARRN